MFLNCQLRELIWDFKEQDNYDKVDENVTMLQEASVCCSYQTLIVMTCDIGSVQWKADKVCLYIGRIRCVCISEG